MTHPTRQPSSHPYGPLLDALRGVRWPSRDRVAANATGAHSSRLRGVGGEFVEYRSYRQGDDPRRLDWKLLARSDRPFVRLADDRALLPTAVLLDASASMAFPDGDAGGPSKWSIACALTVGLLSVARAGGDPVGCVVAHPTHGVRWQGRSRRGALEEVMTALGRITPSGSPTLASCVAEIPVTARLVIVTDALGDHDALLDVVRPRMRFGGPATMLQVVAREELEPPAGVYRVADPEAPAAASAVARVLTDRVRGAYADAFARFRAEVAAAWRGIGADHAEVTTAMDAATVIRAVVAQGSASPAMVAGQGTRS